MQLAGFACDGCRPCDVRHGRDQLSVWMELGAWYSCLDGYSAESGIPTSASSHSRSPPAPSIDIMIRRPTVMVLDSM